MGCVPYGVCYKIKPVNYVLYLDIINYPYLSKLTLRFLSFNVEYLINMKLNHYHRHYHIILVIVRIFPNGCTGITMI